MIQILTAVSSPAEAKRFPLGSQAMAEIVLECALNLRDAPVSGFEILMKPSSQAEVKRS